MCIKVPNFVSIASTFAEIWPIIDFSRWRPSAILDLLYVYSDHPRRAFVGLCHCAKSGWNRCSSFDDMPVLMFCKFDLKMPIHIPLWVVFGDLTPYVRYNINQSHMSLIYGSLRFQWYITYAGVYSSSRETAWTKKV